MPADVRSQVSRSNRGRTFPPEPLTAAEVALLLRQCSRRAPTGVRNAAMIATMYRAGLRVGEVLALKPKDVDGDAGVIRVLHGKGNRARTVGIDPSAIALIEKWQVKRKDLGIKRTQPLFSTLQGGPVSSAYMRGLLPRLARRAGIEKRVHAHGLRHSFAAELRAEGVDLGVISRALGHASIAVTHRYVSHLSPQVVIETIRQREWAV